MKKLLTIAFVFLLGIQANAIIKENSYYFEASSLSLKSSSKSNLDELKDHMENAHVQVIEINSFSEDSDYKAAREKAQQYVDYIIETLGVDPAFINVNVYGNQRIKVNFTPESWDRVDIYVFKENEKNVEPSVIIKEIPDNPEVVRPDYQKRPAPDKKEIAENVAIVMPIQFVGGTSKIKAESNDYLDFLHKTLTEHPEYSALIRGHVCCEDNYRMSKKRAKVVYNYLAKKGIDKKRLEYKGYSNTLPLAFPEHTRDDRATNRRVDIIFSKRD
jgi:outer membrane protein OmpA-like peptidoglycan-associated protein